jgi:hypothetical protein
MVRETNSGDRVEHGRIAESWVDWDKYRLFKALGLLGQPHCMA